jgi:hypothetical protein
MIKNRSMGTLKLLVFARRKKNYQRCSRQNSLQILCLSFLFLSHLWRYFQSVSEVSKLYSPVKSPSNFPSPNSSNIIEETVLSFIMYYSGNITTQNLFCNLNFTYDFNFYSLIYKKLQKLNNDFIYFLSMTWHNKE